MRRWRLSCRSGSSRLASLRAFSCCRWACSICWPACCTSADSRHYGRLAGFTNRKDKHTTRAGYQPWVLLRESKGKTATA
ncbi:DNA-primase RepB domain-containing protein, partial [Escherichia coli]|nr:DNA-primase RepB domain-containing protein [Escherichia coli]